MANPNRSEIMWLWSNRIRVLADSAHPAWKGRVIPNSGALTYASKPVPKRLLPGSGLYIPEYPEDWGHHPWMTSVINALGLFADNKGTWIQSIRRRTQGFVLSSEWISALLSGKKTMHDVFVHLESIDVPKRSSLS